MFRLLLKSRYLSFAAVAVLLAYLIVFGRRVTYEQSIKSFFADDDPAMAAYQEAARRFGDDNFVFLVYDDPGLLTPAGMDRVAELAESVGPGIVEGVLRVESLDAMPLLWAVDDLLLALDKLPAFARRLAVNRANNDLVVFALLSLVVPCLVSSRRLVRLGGALMPRFGLAPSTSAPSRATIRPACITTRARGDFRSSNTSRSA